MIVENQLDRRMSRTGGIAGAVGRSPSAAGQSTQVPEKRGDEDGKVDKLVIMLVTVLRWR